MNELKEDTQRTNNDEENVTETSETIMEPKESPTKEEKISIPIEEYTTATITLAKHNIGLKSIASEDVNPLYYEIGPFPRRPQRVWVQLMGLQPVASEGEPLIYEPNRNDFVRLVFTIVFIMLVCTCGICVFCSIFEPVRSLYKKYALIILICGCIMTIAMSYVFTCSACSRKFPCNVICLVLTVIAYSVIVAYFIIKYKANIIALAIGVTGIIVLVCLGLACTSFDFTRFILIVAVAMMAVGLASMAYLIYCLITKEPIKPLHLALLIVGTLIHSVMLIIEFQMVIGGKTVELSQDDYALGAYMIYSSIITIFIKMMQIIGIIDDM